MTIANRGTKRRCPNCGAAYYDLQRSPVVCPKCHAPYVETPRVPVRANRARAAEVPPPVEEAADEVSVFDEDEALPSDDMEEDIVPDEDHEDEGGEDRD